MLFLIRALDIGGAQRQLIELLKGLDPQAFRAGVAVLYPGGALERELTGLTHLEVLHLGKRGRWDFLGFLWRLLTTARRFRPDVVYGYQPVANELALLAGWACRAPVIWGLRTANANYAVYHWSMVLVMRLGALLSYRPAAIVSNSEAGLKSHVTLGFSPLRMRVIANGIDCNRFTPNTVLGAALRSRWGIPSGARVVGMVARIDPHKDHSTMLAAVQQLNDLTGTEFVLIGDGAPHLRRALEAEVQARGLLGRVRLVGEGGEMPAVFAALDILVSSSTSEGFSNVIAEAMSTGVPCVVTDAGDSARIVGDAGEVVPMRDPAALANAIRRMLTHLGPALSEASRSRILNLFSRARMVSETSELLQRVAREWPVDG